MVYLNNKFILLNILFIFLFSCADDLPYEEDDNSVDTSLSGHDAGYLDSMNAGSPCTLRSYGEITLRGVSGEPPCASAGGLWILSVDEAKTLARCSMDESVSISLDDLCPSQWRFTNANDPVYGGDDPEQYRLNGLSMRFVSSSSESMCTYNWNWINLSDECVEDRYIPEP